MYFCFFHNLTTGATSGAEIAHSSGAPEYTIGFSGVRGTRSLVLCVYFVDRCLSFCTFFVIVLSGLLRFTDSDNPFGIFKLFSMKLFNVNLHLKNKNEVSLQTSSGWDESNTPLRPYVNQCFVCEECHARM